MRRFARLSLPAVLALVWPVAAQTRMRVYAPDGRVPLHIAPGAAAEVIQHVPSGTEIDALDDATNTWIRVVPPPQACFWIYAELVRDGMVSVNQAQVRAGAGLTHKSLMSLDRGTAVAVRSRVGDWLKIAAPTGVVLWVAGKHAATTSATLAAGATAEQPAGEFRQSDRRSQPAPYPLRCQTLAESRSQGEIVEIRGRLDWSSQWRRNLPVSFDLLATDRPDSGMPAFQLVASASAYETLIGCAVRVTGSLWWLADDPLPVVIAGRVEEIAKPAPDDVSSPEAP